MHCLDPGRTQHLRMLVGMGLRQNAVHRECSATGTAADGNIRAGAPLVGGMVGHGIPVSH